MASAGTNCLILLLPNEQLEKLCSYLTPHGVCQLEQTCSQLQERMNQQSIWKIQVERFPVQGIPFGDSSEATFSKLRRRWDYFNQRLLNFFIEEPEYFGWHNPYRVALRTKFSLDSLLKDVKHFMENDLEEALGELKEEANMNPERDWNYKYPLKIWQVKVDLEEHDKWDFECRDYLLKWIVHGRIIPDKLYDRISNDENIFKIETYVDQEILMMDESDSESEE